MNAATAIAIKLGIESLLAIWANHAGKPPGWKPGPEDWLALDVEVENASPEARLALAKLRAAQFPVANGATTETN